MTVHADNIKTLRVAAEAIRGEWASTRGPAWLPVQGFHLAVADWLDAEAVTQEAIGGFAELISVAIETSGGPAGYLRLSRDEAGEPQMSSDVMPAALRAARAYLGEPE